MTSYLADKGFKIHDMFSRYAAGLYKLPTRLRGQIRLTDNEVRTTMKVSKIIHTCSTVIYYIDRSLTCVSMSNETCAGRVNSILNKTVPISHIDLASKHLSICGFFAWKFL